MAYLTGLKKQINKANQFMTEKISGVEGTKLDDDFHTMEKKTDLFVELVDDLQIKTKEYLQPNPTVRAKMAAVKGISKLSGQAKASTYPQPEGTLGEAMLNYGNKLQDFERESVFASSLIESGEALKGMADLKYALDDNGKQDYDCKKRKQQSGGGVPDKEIKQAEDKFAESLHLAQMGMHNIMEADIEQISQLMQFADALLEYHKQCSEILQGLTETLYSKSTVASSRQRREFTPKTLDDLGIDTSNDYTMSAPAVERALRNSSSNRSGTRSSSTARSSSESTSSRPSSQPNFSTQLPDLDPWDTMEKVATAPAPPAAWSGTSSGTSAGWTVFPESSPAAAPRAAWGTGPPQVAHTINNNSYKPHNGFKSGNLISPGDSPTHQPGSQLSSGFNSGVPSPRHTPVSTPTTP